MFTVGKVDIELHEDKWDALEDADNDGIPDVAENITPTKTITKDPSIKNIGINDAWVYLEITVPMRYVITANADGSRSEIAYTELFSFTKNADWDELSRTVAADKSEVVYVYAYNKVIKANEQTKTLFDHVTFANVIEGQNLEETTQLIRVMAKAIQSDGTGTAAQAYDKYNNQNKFN